MGYLKDVETKIRERLADNPTDDEFVEWIKKLVYQSYKNGLKQDASGKAPGRKPAGKRQHESD